LAKGEGGVVTGTLRQSQSHIACGIGISSDSDVNMFDVFLTPEYAVFSVAFLLMIGVGMVEAIGLGAGQIDSGMAVDLDASHGNALDWLGIGNDLPILIWLTSLLGCFTFVGVAIQQIMTFAIGAPLHWALASTGALIIGSVANRFVSSCLVKIVPALETTVIESEDLIMRRGVILEGIARRGHPARAKVLDQHKQAHYVMVEPHNDDDVITQGETAMLVRKEGAVFFGLPDEHPTLRPI
jgi:Protein of unknown function (DUF1449)